MSKLIPRRVLLTVALALLFAFFGRAETSAAEPVGRRWALLIGVEEYVNMEALKFCAADMQALAKELEACGFEKARITLLTDSAGLKLKPLKNNIDRQLEMLVQLVQEKDVVLVAFSGHGYFSHADGNSYWCPADADHAQSAQTMICVEDVYKKLENSRASLRLILADACRDIPQESAGLRRTSQTLSTDFAKQLEHTPDSIALLASCSPGQISRADPKLSHGVFTHFVLEGLRGKADVDRDGNVTLGELWDFAGDKTSLHVRETFNDVQIPRRKGDLSKEADRFPLRLASVESVTPSLPSVPSPALPARPAVGGVLEKGIGLKLVLIPAGEFEMGSNERDFEKPVHRVRLTKPFYLGQTEVTRGQWESVMGTTPWKGESSVQEGAEYPATYVSWNDAVEFCRKLSVKEGKTYRLPTEAEWEYACRAGTTTKYSFGDDESRLSEYAWYDKNAYDVDEKAKYEHRVATKQANPWGLYDLHGNVWEWCEDRYGEKYYGDTSAGSDPSGPVTGSDRVVRGGGWYDSPALCRSTIRFGVSPDRRSGGSLGFRVALVP